MRTPTPATRRSPAAFWKSMARLPARTLSSIPAAPSAAPARSLATCSTPAPSAPAIPPARCTSPAITCRTGRAGCGSRSAGALRVRSACRIAHDLDLLAPEELAAMFDISNSIADLNAANITRRMDELHAGGGNGFSTTGLSLHDIHGALALDSGLPLFASTGRAVENLRASRRAGKSSKEIEMAGAEEDRWGFFISGDGEFTDIRSDGNGSGYNLTTAGVTLGLDYKVDRGFSVGISAGYAHTWADLVDNGRVTVDGGRGGLYATWFEGGHYINAAVSGGGNS